MVERILNIQGNTLCVYDILVCDQSEVMLISPEWWNSHRGPAGVVGGQEGKLERMGQRKM